MTDQEKLLKSFWLAMTDIYGQQWLKEHGEEPGPMWKGALSDLTKERIKMAVIVCRDHGDNYPINLSTFMARARAVKLKKPEQKLLPPKPVSPETKEQFSKAIDARKKRGRKVRSIFLHGESWNDVVSAKAKAMRDGKTMYQFKWARLKANGWTEDDELAYYNAARGAHYSLYNNTTNLMVDVGE